MPSTSVTNIRFSVDGAVSSHKTSSWLGSCHGHCESRGGKNRDWQALL